MVVVLDGEGGVGRDTAVRRVGDVTSVGIDGAVGEEKHESRSAEVRRTPKGRSEEGSLVLEGVLVERSVGVVVGSKLKNAGVGVGCRSERKEIPPRSAPLSEAQVERLFNTHHGVPRGGK